MWMEISLVESSHASRETASDHQFFDVCSRREIQRIAIGNSQDFGGEELLKLCNESLDSWLSVDFFHNQTPTWGKRGNAI
jgi:hypothetical protein